MEQEKIAELVKLIMADKRIRDLISSGAGERRDLTLIESRELFEALPFELRGNVCCQELPDGGGGFLDSEAAARGDWNRIRIYQPSLNLIAKLALGIADEPLTKIIQQKLAEGAENIELLHLCNLFGIKGASYKKLFLGYIDRIRSYGIRTGVGAPAAEVDFPATEGAFSTEAKNQGANGLETNAVIWQFRALTERDLLDMEKGTAITVGRKCIVTSLAIDAARRKSIQICREGEVR